jgi:hypothetical protein
MITQAKTAASVEQAMPFFGTVALVAARKCRNHAAGVSSLEKPEGKLGPPAAMETICRKL